ncbi:MAG: hypothetical protein WCT13_00890 [Patescibacteria group bacterium]
MCDRTQWNVKHVLVVQSVFPTNKESPVGCARNVLLCTCGSCMSSNSPMTPAGPLHSYLNRCFEQDIADAVAGGYEPPVNLLSMPKLDPRTGTAKPTKRQAATLIRQIGPDALSSDIVAAYA